MTVFSRSPGAPSGAISTVALASRAEAMGLRLSIRHDAVTVYRLMKGDKVAFQSESREAVRDFLNSGRRAGPIS